MYGTIKTKTGSYSYQITDRDIQTLAVAVWKEGGDPLSTIWTYFQRMAAFRSRSLHSLLLAHSQPINPRWNAANCAGSARASGGSAATYCSASQLERRADNARLLADRALWERTVPAEIRNLVTRTAQALESNPVPRAIDFADVAVTTGYLSRPAHWQDYVVKAAPEGRPSQNWYVTDSQSRDWPADFVRVEYQGRVATGNTLPVANLTLAQRAELTARRLARGDTGAIVPSLPTAVSLSSSTFNAGAWLFGGALFAGAAYLIATRKNK